MSEAKQFFKGLLYTLALGILYLVICPIILAVILKNFLLSDNFWISNLAYLALYLITLLIIFLIVKKDIIKQFKDFLKKPKEIINKGLSYWGYGLLVMIGSNLVISSFVNNISVNEQMARETLFEFPLYAIPVTILIGPFLEEVIFRYALRKSFNKKTVYALTSAFIFGLLHVLTAIDEFTIANLLSHWKEFLFIIPYGSLGYFFAKAYYETDNLFSSIIPHVLHNSLSVALVLLSSFLLGG